ncbi:MAG: hypothetical protein Q8911_00325 [Bacillota bacterium]|nr:hypothetical protein [Bacillota bacterium]
MQECSLKNKCRRSFCDDCDIAQALAEAEKQPSTYVTAKLTDEQFNWLLKRDCIKVEKSYHFLPNNASIWFWIAVAVISVFGIIYNH